MGKENEQRETLFFSCQSSFILVFVCLIWPATNQGPTQIAPTSMGTAQNIGGHTGASSSSSSSLRVPPPAGGDALIPVQQALSSVPTATAQNVPRGTGAQVPPVTALTGPRDTPASSSQVPPENANAPVQQHPRSITEILMKILDTLVEITTKQDQMLRLMAEGHTRTRTRDEQEDQGQESPDSRRQRLG